MDAQQDAVYGPGKRLLFIGIAVAVVLVVAEAGAFAVGKFLQSRYKMYVPPAPVASERIKSYADYERLRDPRLGWPFKADFGADFFDPSGARWSPAFRDPAKFANTVAIFGDSYAAGSEVDDDHSWGNQLALSLGSRVGIFGVPGYGTDQAYVRFLSMESDPARVVILSHLSEDVPRNLTRDWDLFTHARNYALKPRFVLDSGGALREVPLPRLTESEYLRSVGVDSPLLPLEHENFQPGGPAGMTLLAFPYSIAVLRNLFGYQVRSLIARRPDYAEFYEKGHPMAGLEITSAILESFQAEARKRGKWPLVLLLATRHDVNYFRKTGKWTYASLVERLREAKVNYIDFGPTLVKQLGDRDVMAVFKPLGHYNEEASKLLADTVHETLRTRGPSLR
jgi:hypothetical protein